MTNKKPGIIRRFFSFLARIYRGFRKIILNLVFILIVLVIGVSIFSGDEKINVPETAALVLNLNGNLVEEKVYVDPIEAALNESLGASDEAKEILVSDVISVINHASKDDRIKVMMLDLANFGSASQDKLKAVGNALEAFKASGKKIFAFGSYFGQNQYYLASYADEISVTPMGTVLLEGYGSYPMYYKNAMEKLKLNTHVFRVGTYKSAVEPFLRNDMSDEAKDANLLVLNEIWASYKQDVGSRRNIAENEFDETFAALITKLKSADGDLAQYAVNARLVDNIKTTEAFRQDLIALVGKNDKHSFNQVNFDDYASLVLPNKAIDNPMTDKVAVIVARGVIVDGTAKAGTIGGDSTAALLRKARFDEKVKAVVLRIDSPGGSANASEVIGQEIRFLREAGKPVIASMGGVAASGGYWIAAPANEIWAAPTTITGSIGIFGVMHTAEKLLPTLGLNVDGVGTTELAGFAAGVPLFKGLSTDMQDLMQLLIERGYKEFLTMVGSNRNMTVEQVDAVAQGRIWTGAQALERGLVDKLGSFDDAIKAAAALSSLSHYDVKVITHELSPNEQLIADLLGNAQAKGLLPSLTPSPEKQLLNKLTKHAKQDLLLLNQFNDPNGIYSYCLMCSIN